MQSLPSWIPAPRSWVNSLALISLMLGLKYVIYFIWTWLSFLMRLFPWIGYLYGFIALISPILAITFLHHWLHQALDNFFPESRIPGTEDSSGIFPGIFSWWQGLYGWFTSTFSGLVVLYIAGIFYPSLSLANVLNSLAWTPTPVLYVPVIKFVAQVLVAAYLYHMEFLVQQRLMTAGR